MEQEVNSYSYDPHHPLSYPFTIISTRNNRLLSKSITQPFFYEVYCPLSCKKVKIGYCTDKNFETMEFHSTTSRVVRAYLEGNNIRFLVNNFKPVNKDKQSRKVSGNKWRIDLDVQDLGNIAILNPYCVDPKNPISFYTFNQIQKVEKPINEWNFKPLESLNFSKIKTKDSEVLVAQNYFWIGFNPFFGEETLDEITLRNPRDKLKYQKFSTKEILLTLANNLNYWLGELKNTILLQESENQNKEIQVSHNLDVIYSELDFTLNLLEQVRARFMNDTCQQSYNEYFSYHPRLYSAIERLGSFINYGNTKYNVKNLAQCGFFNKTDMLQSVFYFQLPNHEITTFEEENISNEEKLRSQLFPASRLVRDLPFPNVDLETFCQSLHPQRLLSKDEHLILAKDFSEQHNYLTFVSSEGKISVWNSELTLYKMFEINYIKPTIINEDKKRVPDSELAHSEIFISNEESQIQALFDQNPATEITQKIAIQPEEIKPDPAMLDQIIMMGYGPSTVSKALIRVKNQSIIAALDAILQIQKEEKSKLKNKSTTVWTCSVCTYKNEAHAELCQICGEMYSGIGEEEEQLRKILEAELLAQEKQLQEQKEAERKRNEEKQKIQRQKQQKKEKLEKQAEEQRRKYAVQGVKLVKLEGSIDPFFIFLLLKNQDGEVLLKGYRVGMNRINLVKFGRFEKTSFISNFTRKIIPNITYQNLSETIQESQQQIQCMSKIFEPASDKDWFVIQELTLKIEDKAVNRIEKCSKNTICLFSNDKPFKKYQIKTEDTLVSQTYQLVEAAQIEEEEKKVAQQIKQQKKDEKNKYSIVGNSIQFDETIEEITLEVVEHIPHGNFKPICKQEDHANQVNAGVYSDNLVMSQFIPLHVQNYEGSLFSRKHSSTSLLSKNDKNPYTSNYPTVSFIFKSIDNKPMLVESATIISKTNRIQKIYPITGGLIFTADHASWFEIAKNKFCDMDKEGYEKWLTAKHKSSNPKPAFWEPVAYFQVNNQTEFQLSFKRVAKYLFLLPTQYHQKNKDEVAALKIDFFGVKGRIEQDIINTPELIEKYKFEKWNSCEIVINEDENSQWKQLNAQKYSITSACNPNTYHFAPKNTPEHIPLSVSTAFQIKFKTIGSKKQIKLQSEHIQKIKVLELKQRKQNFSEQNITSFKDLLSTYEKLGNLNLMEICQNLNIEDLILIILEGKQFLTQYENIFAKIMKLPGYEEKIAKIIFRLLPKMFEESIQVSETGYKIFIRVFEQLSLNRQEEAKEAICEAWRSSNEFTSAYKNKNYNILRNQYKIEELVLEPALFSKDYYRLINPQYVEEDKSQKNTAEPHTPINCRVFIENKTNFNYIYYIDTINHQNVNKIEFYFPKEPPGNRYKIIIRICELCEIDSNNIQEKQLYYRYFTEDLLVYLASSAYKGTEIFKKTLLNYLSIPIHSKSRFLKIYVDYLALTTYVHPNFKEFSEPYIAIPTIYSEKNQAFKENDFSLDKVSNSALKKICESFPAETKHNSSQTKLPPHRYFSVSNRSQYIVHEFKSKYTHGVDKNQFSEVIEKITQNILDKNIVMSEIKSLRVGDYPLGYKGLDFVYTFVINLMKIYRRFPSEFKINTDVMFLLFDMFVLFEEGPIMKITTATLIDLYNRLNSAEKSEFVDVLIFKYLENVFKSRSNKISEKYQVEKITTFLEKFELPHGKLFEILATTESVLLTTILFKLIMNNFETFGMNKNLQIYKNGQLVKVLSYNELYACTFSKCLWVLDNVRNITSQILETGLDLFLMMLPVNTEEMEKEEKERGDKTELAIFLKKLEEKDFWKLVFLTLKINNDPLKDRIHQIFKVFIANLNESFLKGINSMLLEIIKKENNSLYQEINPNISDEARMNHLQTILEYLSLTKSTLFLDTSTAISLLSLPLTPTLWSLAFKIIPRNETILLEIINRFNPNFYTALSKQIMEFCSPLSGIRPIQSNFINWLELIREIKIQKKSIFDIFIKNLEKTNLGGSAALTMAPIYDVKQLEVTNQFSKLVNESHLEEEYFTEENVKILISWYYLNFSTADGSSPATDLIKLLSENIAKIFENTIELPQVLKVLIKAALKARQEGQIAEKLLEDKKLSASCALGLNRRFSRCFENLLSIFNISDELHQYFTFEIGGLEYILEKIGLESKERQDNVESAKKIEDEESEEEFLISQGLICKDISTNKSHQTVSTSVQLKQEEFGNNVQLVPNQNFHGITSLSNDWTTQKKGSKTKVIYLPMIDQTYYEYPLTIQINRVAEIRSIKIGFPAASYEFADKLIATPSAVRIEGSIDMKHFEPIGQLERIYDDGYSASGVAVFALNLHKIRKSSKISIKDSVEGFGCYRLKYLRIFVGRPVISFIQGQFSPLNGKNYKVLGSNISFMSLTGDDVEKLPFRMVNSCKQISKESALSMLSSIISESNPITTAKIANSPEFVSKIKENFKAVKQEMKAYPNIVPQILYIIGSNNEEFGDWIIQTFLEEGQGDIQAKIINKIIVSTPDKIHKRLNIFLKYIFRKIHQIAHQSEIESGLLYSGSVAFIQSFCKTLQESYKIDTGDSVSTVQCTPNNIDDIITIYDQRYSSPEIKTINKLFINILYIHAPLKPSEQLIEKSLTKIWQKCSDSKTHFYSLLATLLVNIRSIRWVSKDDHQLTKTLIQNIQQNIEKSNHKALQPQIYLLSVISATSQNQYMRSQNFTTVLYNSLKTLSFDSFQIYKHFVKIIQNTILSHDSEQNFAKQLIEDVSLIAKRKDPLLQKFYTTILGLQPEINVCLQNFSVEEPKKEIQIPSKLLTNKNSLKMLGDKLPKSIKFNLSLEHDFAKISLNLPHKPKVNLYEQLLSAINSSHFLLVIKIKLSSNKNAYLGCYNPGKAFRQLEDSYCWEDILNNEKGSFMFTFYDGQHKFVQHAQTNKPMISLSGGDDALDEFLILFNQKNDSIVRISCHPNQKTYAILPNSPEELKIESFQIFSGAIKSVSGSGTERLNSISTKAGYPYSLYRHSPVFILPSKMTVSKLLQIIGVQGVCSYQNAIVDGEANFEDLSNQSEDKIVDLEIKTQSLLENKDDLGIIPEMTIFKKFSEMKGIEEVLEVGLKSVKEWNKADKKKNFEHYFEELKNFGKIPFFFELFIKNHNSVTFLLQVVSGLPDDPNSSRNWEEEEIVHSKFMYKIVSDVFKFNRSPSLRDMDNYTGFCQVILLKLAQISKEGVRKFEEEQAEKQNEPEAPPVEKKKSEQPQKLKKKKGIGYGADGGGNSKWSAAEWIEHRKNISQQIQRIVCIFASFLQCERPLTDPRIAEVLKNSCLLPLLENALRSGSLLDISKEAQLFKNYLTIIRNLASNPATLECILDIDKRYKPSQTESIHTLLVKLHGISQIFLDCMKSGKQADSGIPAEIADNINKTYQFVDRAVKNITKKKHVMTIEELQKLPVSKSYKILLENLRFGYVDMKVNNQFKHFYASTISTGSPATNKILRLSQQLADLSSSLPCQSTNSIYVRCDKSRIDVIKILIMGSKDTPYSNGAFCFDLYCDDNYPNHPPKMSITTTGSGRIRFNPNLYSCGKVCLSLLGTWRGQASENWDAKLSTLLQLFISTQGITMSEEVYFNEPGLEGEQGTVEGEKKNEGYSNIVRIGNVRYAMNEQIKNPTKGFEDVIKRHFYIKKKEILEEVEKWLEWADKKEAAYTGLVNDHNMSWSSDLKSSKGKYKELLLKQYNELKELLEKIPAPDLEEKEEEITFESQKIKKKTKAKEVKLGEIDVSYDPFSGQEMKYEEDVIQDRWSRYVGAMGLEAVKKQSESCVLLLGLKPLGLEIAKNLVLSGLKQLTIVDNDSLGMGSEEHFYMSDMKNKKIEDCIFKIKELNPYMLVRHEKAIPSDISRFHIVVSTQTIDSSLSIAEQCRKLKIKFIHTQTAGVSGTFFADLGEEFSIHDTNGEEPFEGLIKNITCEENGVVTLLDGVKHTYEDGDYIVIDKIDGMQIIEEKVQQKSQAQIFYENLTKNKPSNSINGRVFEVKVINWNSFSIGDTSNFKPYTRNGMCKGIKLPKKVHFKSFKEAVTKFQEFLDPNMSIYDFEKMGDNFSIFICFQAYSKFIEQNKRKPKNWDVQQSNKFMEILKKQLELVEKTPEEKEKIIKFGEKFACIAEAELPTIGAYLGGIASQEVIKALTNKYTPIKQFFTFHLNEIIQKIPEAPENYKQLQIKEDETFAGLKIVVGRQGSMKVQKMKAMIIGAGAIGCELLKNFAMINMGAQGTITVTDPDHIETSNLTRQFLFRQKHVKKPKSATAAATLVQMNPMLKQHISARLDKVCEQTEDIYSDEFFESQNIVANALDNVRARVYVDKRCVHNKKPLFESGTLGPKGHVQVIIPDKTQNYGNQNDPTEESQIPHCTLKMFPEQTVHCIEWSRDIFGKVFTLNPKALKKVIQTKDTNSVEGQQRDTVSRMIEYRPLNFEDCVSEAVRKFFRYFRNNVRQLLHTYPLDMKTKEGKLFWELPKRPPKQISEIDFTDELHQTFISSYAVNLAKVYNLPYPKNFRKPEGREQIMKIAKNAKIEDFVPSAEESAKLQKMTQAEETKDKKEEKMMEEEQTAVQPTAEKQIKLNAEILQIKIIPEEFEKDEDSNGHIDLIYSMSNLRCRNYGLNECKWIDAKLKAGKIMAALSTTTSVVAALQTIQILKYMVGSTQWRNAFTNLAVPLVQISEPGQAPKHKIGQAEFTVWDVWTFKCSTLDDLLQQLKEKYKVEGYNINTDQGKPVFWQAMYVGKDEARENLLKKPLNKMFEQKEIQLNILMRELEGGEQGKKIYEQVPRIKVEII